MTFTATVTSSSGTPFGYVYYYLDGSPYPFDSQTLDANGTPIGTAHLLGGGDSARVTWNGSMFVVVSEASMALVAADGSVLVPLTPLLAADSAQSVIAGDTIATWHSAIDTGVGDTNVIFVRSFTLTPPRHRATRP